MLIARYLCSSSFRNFHFDFYRMEISVRDGTAEKPYDIMEYPFLGIPDHSYVAYFIVRMGRLFCVFRNDVFSYKFILMNITSLDQVSAIGFPIDSIF